MKDFDLNLNVATEEERTFTIRGKQFTFGPRVSANELAKFEDFRFDPEKTTYQVLEQGDVLMKSVLNGGAEEWDWVRSEAQPPLSFQDIIDVIEHVLEVTSRRPTEKSDGSGATPSRPGTRSKAGSS